MDKDIPTPEPVQAHWERDMDRIKEEKESDLSKKEMVHHPDHYNKGIEVIKFTNSWNLNFPRGSVVKYICRGGHKDPAEEIVDLQKAKKYIDFEIERIQNESN